MKKIYLLLLIIISFTAFSQNKPAPDDNKVYNTAGLDGMPEFPGGVMAFRKIFESGIDKSAIKGPDAKTFKVYVSFIIEKDGTMTDEKVLRDPGFGLGKQVLGLLEKTKDKWSPGKIGGKAVRVLYHYPITITVP
jgi:protein TonB